MTVVMAVTDWFEYGWWQLAGCKRTDAEWSSATKNQKTSYGNNLALLRQTVSLFMYAFFNEPVPDLPSVVKYPWESGAADWRKNMTTMVKEAWGRARKKLEDTGMYPARKKGSDVNQLPLSEFINIMLHADKRSGTDPNLIGEYDQNTGMPHAQPVWWPATAATAHEGYKQVQAMETSKIRPYHTYTYLQHKWYENYVKSIAATHPLPLQKWKKVQEVEKRIKVGRKRKLDDDNRGEQEPRQIAPRPRHVSPQQEV